jgi:hypothetical protein
MPFPGSSYFSVAFLVVTSLEPPSTRNYASPGQSVRSRCLLIVPTGIAGTRLTESPGSFPQSNREPQTCGLQRLARNSAGQDGRAAVQGVLERPASRFDLDTDAPRRTASSAGAVTVPSRLPGRRRLFKRRAGSFNSQGRCWAARAKNGRTLASRASRSALSKRSTMPPRISSSCAIRRRTGWVRTAKIAGTVMASVYVRKRSDVSRSPVVEAFRGP